MKTVRSDSTRKPPTTFEDHRAIVAWIENSIPKMQPILFRLDELICKKIDGLQFSLKWKKAYYGLSKNGWIIELVGYDVSVNLVFLSGAAFKHPPPLGSGGKSRYIKLTSIEEIELVETNGWIEQAAVVDGWKV